MNPHEKLAKEKADKEKSLNKQLKVVEARIKELRNVALTTLDPAFVRRNLDKYTAERKRITDLLSKI